MNKNSRSITVRNTSPQEVAEFIREVNGKESRKFKVVYDDGRIEWKRLFVNGERIGYLAPRKKKTGYLFDLQGVYAISCDLPQEVDRNAQFERNAKRLMELLEKSGLWPMSAKKFKDCWTSDTRTIANRTVRQGFSIPTLLTIFFTGTSRRWTFGRDMPAVKKPPAVMRLL